MKLTIERDDLTGAMGRVGGIVATKSPSVILAGVLLTAEPGALRIRANNLDMEAVETISADVAEVGEIVVNAAMIGDIARALSAGSQVRIEPADGARLAVKSGRSRFLVGGLSPDAFSGLWSEDFQTILHVDAELLLRMLRRVSYAQADLGTRPMLLGVHAHEVGGRLRMIASDGVVASYYDGPEVEPFEGVTIPTAMVAQMESLLSTISGGTVQLCIAERRVALVAGRVGITSKLVDRDLKFPVGALAGFYGQARTHGVVLSLPTLKQAIKRASLAAGGTVKTPSLRFVFSPGVLTISGRNMTDEAVDEIEVDYAGPETIMGFNANKLNQTLAAVSGELVAFAFSDKYHPTVWTPADDSAGIFLINPQAVA